MIARKIGTRKLIFFITIIYAWTLEYDIISRQFLLVSVAAIFLHPLAEQIQFVSILELVGTFHLWLLV